MKLNTSEDSNLLKSEMHSFYLQDDASTDSLKEASLIKDKFLNDSILIEKSLDLKTNADDKSVEDQNSNQNEAKVQSSSAVVLDQVISQNEIDLIKQEAQKMMEKGQCVSRKSNLVSFAQPEQRNTI